MGSLSLESGYGRVPLAFNSSKMLMYGNVVNETSEYTLRENCVKIINELFKTSYGHRVVSIELHSNNNQKNINEHIFETTLSFNPQDKSNIFVSRLIEEIT